MTEEEAGGGGRGRRRASLMKIQRRGHERESPNPTARATNNHLIWRNESNDETSARDPKNTLKTSRRCDCVPLFWVLLLSTCSYRNRHAHLTFKSVPSVELKNNRARMKFRSYIQTHQKNLITTASPSKHPQTTLIQTIPSNDTRKLFCFRLPQRVRPNARPVGTRHA